MFFFGGCGRMNDMMVVLCLICVKCLLNVSCCIIIILLIYVDICIYLIMFLKKSSL